jgi:hypothetical protein
MSFYGEYSKMRKITTGYCIGIVFLFMLSIAARYFTQNVLIEKLNMDNFFTRLVFFDRLPDSSTPPGQIESEPEKIPASTMINWEEIYPFKDAGIHSAVVRPPNAFVKYKNKISHLQERIGKYTKEWLVNRVGFVETAAGYEALLGWTLLMQEETLIVLNDGHLMELIPKWDVTEYTVNLYKLYDYLVKSGVEFLYVQCPYKISKDDITIAGISDFSNKNADELLYGLSQKNIPFLDLRSVIQQENLDHHNLFYKTDHHWKGETGLWAARVIGGYLNTHNQFEIDIRLLDPDQYKYEVYPNWFLGSWGKKISLARTEPEDISLIYPVFDTDFSFKSPMEGIDRRGGFEIFYVYDHINQIDYYNADPYSAYLNAGSAVQVIHNNTLLDNGRRLLIITDSFGVLVAPFLALGIETIHMINLRIFSGSVEAYIEEYKPDMVMVMYNPMMLVPTPFWPRMFEFK